MTLRGTEKPKNTPAETPRNHVQELLDEIADFLGSRTSEGFFRKAIRLLGVGLVREAKCEVADRVLTGNPTAEPIQDKERYLVTLLVRWMKERCVYDGPDDGEAWSLTQTPALCQTPLDGKDAIETLNYPFSPDLIQWLYVMGPEYFTLTNDTKRSDRVENTRLSVRGRFFDVPMLRGKKTRNDEERGIPTTEHVRVLGAVERIWADNRGPHERVGRCCVVRTTAAEIASYMGVKLDGHAYKRIESKLNDLGGTGYCYLLNENPELKALGLKEMSFQFFGEVKSLIEDVQGRKMTHFHIKFSSDYSAALLARDKGLVSRPVDMLTIRGDIALKLYVYLYPLLSSKKEHVIELGFVLPGGEKTGLLKALNLKTAGWMSYKSQRRREFEKAIKEIDGRKDHKGRPIRLEIVDGLNPKDFMLRAWLEEQ